MADLGSRDAFGRGTVRTAGRARCRATRGRPRWGTARSARSPAWCRWTPATPAVAMPPPLSPSDDPARWPRSRSSAPAPARAPTPSSPRGTPRSTRRALPDRPAVPGKPLQVIFGDQGRRRRPSSAADYRVVPGARVELPPGAGHTPSWRIRRVPPRFSRPSARATTLGRAGPV